MPTITTSREVNLLQLQYTADSCGLRRTYLPDLGDTTTNSADTELHKAGIIALEPHETLLGNPQPDIEWLPSLKTYLDRVKRLSMTAYDRPTTVPEGFPESIDAARVWSGDEFSDSERYIVRLSEHDVSEIKTALASFKCWSLKVPSRFFALPI